MVPLATEAISVPGRRSAFQLEADQVPYFYGLDPHNTRPRLCHREPPLPFAQHQLQYFYFEQLKRVQHEMSVWLMTSVVAWRPS